MTRESVSAIDPGLAPGQPPRLPTAGFALAWGVFWLLMLLLAMQDHLRQGRADLWKPLLWEGTSFVAATLLLGLQWRRVPRFDALITQPWRWFAAHVLWLPPAALAFVALVYGLRHGAYALVGQVYQHEPWPTVLRYEALKFSLFYLLFVAVLFGFRSHAALADARLRAERARTLAQEAQLTQLVQQLEPHFLFNALNTIASTVHSDPDLADALLGRLAALLRATTDLSRQPEVTLAEEVRLLEAYVAIMRERFADRATVHFQVDPGVVTCRVPTLVLQPLVENAFRHAVEPRKQHTTIVVSARRDAGRLQLSVEDDGGLLPAVPAFGVGLTNLQRRLAVRYGDAGRLSIEPGAVGGGEGGDGRGVIARLDLPCEC